MKLNKKVKTLLTSGLVVSLATTVAFAAEQATQFSGKDRVSTSLMVAKYTDYITDNAPRPLVIVNGYNQADALSATNLVNKYNARLLLVKNETNIREELEGFNISEAYKVGGDSTLNGHIVQDLTDVMKEKGKEIIRIEGKNRYETNRKTLEMTGYKTVGVASGEDFADALAAAGVLFEENLGLMLAPKTSYDPGEYNVKYTFGGVNSVSQDGGERIAGKNRYETSKAIMRKIKSKTAAVIASGKNFADSLSALNILKNTGGSMVLADGKLDDEQFEYTKQTPKIFLVGGQVKPAYIHSTLKFNNIGFVNTINDYKNMDPDGDGVMGKKVLVDISSVSNAANQNNNVQNEKNKFYAALNNKELGQSSGVGRFGGYIKFGKDGTFTGKYYDGEMRVIYECNFKGRLVVDKVIDGSRAKVSFKDITLTKKVGKTEKLEDMIIKQVDMRKDLFGKNNIMYLPGYPVNKLPNDMMNIPKGSKTKQIIIYDPNNPLAYKSFLDIYK